MDRCFAYRFFHETHNSPGKREHWRPLSLLIVRDIINGAAGGGGVINQVFLGICAKALGLLTAIEGSSSWHCDKSSFLSRNSWMENQGENYFMNEAKKLSSAIYW